MVSKLLWALQDGLFALKNHVQFIFLGCLLFIVPLTLLFFNEQSNVITAQNIETSQKETVAILHQAIWGTTNISDVTELPSIFSELNTPAELWVFSGLETYDLVYRSEEQIDLINETFLTVAPISKTPLIFQANEEGNRVWYAVSKATVNESTYTIVTRHDFRQLDSVMKNRTTTMLWVIVGVIVLLILIAFWLIKQINWQHKYDDLKKHLDEQDSLIATITHEFRAPLTAMRGYLSFLFESNRLRTKDKDSLVRISLSNERMLKLVNDFLEVSKIQSGKLDMKASKVPVANAVYRAISELGAEASEKSLTLRDGTQDASITLTTDEFRLAQILTNLLNNAIKYTEKGGVVVTYEENPLYVTVRIQDTGSGISADDQKKLFSPFSRVGGKQSLKQTGSGLGMWITKKLVEQLGGTVAVESIHGVGTHVIVRFDKRKIAAKARAGIL